MEVVRKAVKIRIIIAPSPRPSPGGRGRTGGLRGQVIGVLIFFLIGLILSSCSQKEVSREELKSHFDLGMKARDNLDFKKAKEELSRVLEKSPDSPDGIKAQFEIYEIDYEVRWFDGVKQPVLKGRAFSKERRKFIDLGKKLDSLSSQIPPLEEARLRKRLGEFFSGIEARHEAALEFEKALAGLPSNSRERLYILPKAALEYYFINKKDAAGKYMEEAEKIFRSGLEPDYEMAFQLGQAYYHMGEDQPAEKWLLMAREKSPVKDPTDLTQELMTSRLYLQRNDIPKAMESLGLFVSELKKMKPRKFYTDRLFGMMLTYWEARLPTRKVELPVLREALNRLDAAQKAYDEDDQGRCIKELEEMIDILGGKPKK